MADIDRSKLTPFEKKLLRSMEQMADAAKGDGPLEQKRTKSGDSKSFNASRKEPNCGNDYEVEGGTHDKESKANTAETQNE